MDGTRGRLTLFTGGTGFPARPPAPDPLPRPPALALHVPTLDPVVLANQELIRPVTHRRAARELPPFSTAWYDELEQKRYQRHGAWLPAALEFGRHPGESLLLLGPGLGSDAIRYARCGSPVTVGITPADHRTLIAENVARHELPIRLVDLAGAALPFADGTFDVVAWNSLYESGLPQPTRVAELFRVLKAGGKVIGLFPAWYDAGYWQDLVLPLQWLYWRRPADPATGAKTTARQLRRTFTGFHAFKAARRHLRRSELPHLWRFLPLVVLERLLGRVLVFKALKPLSARTGVSIPLAA